MVVLDCPYHRIVNIPNLTLNYLTYSVAQKRKKKQYTDKPEACRSNADFYQFIFPNKIRDYHTIQKLHTAANNAKVIALGPVLTR